MSAEVEVHFDNSSGRFPTEGETVVLRRVIGLKKDNFFLDRRHLSKAEAVSFLESAGFSQANPYFIVQQGRIGALATMRDGDRLALLLEVAGMRVYDERRAESMRLMGDTDRRIRRVDEVLAYIARRLDELEQEQNELAEYNKADRARRALEYALCRLEHREAAAALAALDAEHRAAAAEAEVRTAAELAATAALKDAAKRLRAAAREIARHGDAAAAADAARTALVARVAKLELRERAAVQHRDAARRRAAADAAELEGVTRAIAETEARLAAALPLFREKSAEERSARTEYAQGEQRIDALYARQGRQQRFATRGERDAWLATELRTVRADIADRSALADRTAAEGAKLRAESARLDAEARTTRARAVTDAQALVDAKKQAAAAAREECDALAAAARSMDRSAAAAEADRQAAHDDLGRARRKLECSVSRDAAQGLAAVKDITRRRGLRGVYGPVIENFSVAPEVAMAAEVTAGNGLFYVIVDTDDTAALILDELSRQGVGRVTCMPLNRIAALQHNKHHHSRQQQQQHQQQAAGETGVLAKPLIEEIHFREELRPVFQHLFGKTMLCPTQEAARDANRKLRCNCVTPDGVQLKKRGVWTGGFYDPAASRIEIMRTVRACTELYDAAAAKEAAARKDADELAARRRDAGAQWRRADTELARAREERKALLDAAARAAGDSRAHAELAERREKDAEDLRAAVRKLEAREQALVQEVGSEFLAELTPAERKEIQDLIARRTELAAALEQLARERADLEATCESLRTTLSSNLYRKRDELLTTAAAAATVSRSAQKGDDSLSSSLSSLDDLSLSSLPLHALEGRFDDNNDGDDDNMDVDEDDNNDDDEEEEEGNDNIPEEERAKRRRWRRRLVRLTAEEDDEVAAAKRELEATRKELEEVTQRAQEAEHAGEAAQGERRRIRDEITALEAAERDAQKRAGAVAQTLERLHADRAAAVQRMDEAAKKIKSLGSLPREALEGPEAEERLGKRRGELMSDLRRATEALKSFSHVNKKAHDQYVSFTTQRDQLLGRREELGRARESILGLIAQLDLRKDEAVERTFRGVSKHFSDVFAELVPGGSANLVMLQREDDEDEDDNNNNNNNNNNNDNNDNNVNNNDNNVDNDDVNNENINNDNNESNEINDAEMNIPQDNEENGKKPPQHRKKSRVDLYTGIAVKVTFPGNSEAHYMHQLSGGQQSLVALALILAIQRTDPAPFYLFDEVDANLDATYRVAVAKLVRKYSRNAQFIISSFHPEFVIYAQKWYRVTSTENISHIDSISRDEALAVVRSGTSTDQERAAYDEAAAAAAAAEATEEEEEDDDDDDDEEDDDENNEDEDEEINDNEDNDDDDDDNDERMKNDEE